MNFDEPRRYLHYFNFYSTGTFLLTLVTVVLTLLYPKVYDIYNGYLTAQAKGQDAVTIILIPFFAIALFYSFKNNTKAKFITAGGLAYLLYTYITYSYISYSRFSLLYILIFLLSGVGLLFFALSVDLETDSYEFKIKRGFKFTAYYGMTISVLIGILWIKDLATTLLTGNFPAEVIKNNNCSVIYANDCGFFLPLIFYSSFMLIKKRPIGYVLTAVLLIKEFSIGAAILGMVYYINLENHSVELPMIIIFASITVGSAFANYFFYSVKK